MGLSVCVVFVCIFAITYGKECIIPENTKEVTFSSSEGCSSFSMETNGNYATLEKFRNDGSRPNLEAVYDLLKKLEAAPNLYIIRIYYNNSLKTFDIAKFIPLKKVLYVLIGFCSNLSEIVYSAEEDNKNIGYLNFGFDGLTYFDVPFFKKFLNLTRLDLHGNNFSGYFDLGILKNLENLENFSIGSKISHVINTSGAIEMPKIFKIVLDNNKISFIDFKIFESFPNLQELELSGNMLSGTFDMGKLKNLKNLFSLTMADNRLTRITNSGTEDMPNMTNMLFNKNNLTFLDMDDFKIFKNLQTLILSNNKLVLISGYPYVKSHFPKIVQIPVEINEFHCFQLDKMVTPYIRTDFWYQNKEPYCPNGKIMFRNTTCCYS